MLFVIELEVLESELEDPPSSDAAAAVPNPPGEKGTGDRDVGEAGEDPNDELNLPLKDPPERRFELRNLDDEDEEGEAAAGLAPSGVPARDLSPPPPPKTSSPLEAIAAAQIT